PLLDELSDAFVYVGRMLHLGSPPIPENREAAARWYARAIAIDDHPVALTNTALLLQASRSSGGANRTFDLARAAALYEKAIAKGASAAMANLALMHMNDAKNYPRMME